MSEEISKHTIAVLVILTVVISFLGTWTVMNEVNKVNVDRQVSTSSSNQQYVGTGKVTLNIVDPATINGKVTLDIKG